MRATIPSESLMIHQSHESFKAVGYRGDLAAIFDPTVFQNIQILPEGCCSSALPTANLHKFYHQAFLEKCSGKAQSSQWASNSPQILATRLERPRLTENTTMIHRKQSKAVQIVRFSCVLTFLIIQHLIYKYNSISYLSICIQTLFPHHRIPFCILWTLHSTVNFRTATPHTVAVVMSLGGHLYARKFIHIEVPWQSMQWWMLAKTQQEHWGLGLIQYVNNYCFNLTEIGKKWKKPPNTIFLSLCLFFAFTSLLPWWHVDLQVSATPRSGENSMIRMDHVKILRSSPAVEICCDTFGSKLSKPYPHWHIDPHLSFIRIWRSSSPLTSSRGSCRRDESATCHPADHWTVSATVEDNSSTCICRWIPYP